MEEIIDLKNTGHATIARALEKLLGWISAHGLDISTIREDHFKTEAKLRGEILALKQWNEDLQARVKKLEDLAARTVTQRIKAAVARK